MIFIAGDHAGFDLKEELVSYLGKFDEVFDLGNCKMEKDDDFVDYAKKLCGRVVEEEGSRGILICGTGHGMNIVANKHKGIYATVCLDEESALLARKHNDINVVCLSGRYLSLGMAKKICKVFLETKFLGEKRLVRRNDKIKKLESENFK